VVRYSGEILTKGKGPLGQLGVPLGLPLNPGYAGFGLAVWIGFFLVAAIGYVLTPAASIYALA
jgi:hypothetical protein